MPFLLFQSSKVLAKKELAYVPIIGWMWYFTEMIFCTRKWEQDRRTVATSLMHLRDYPEKYFVRRHPRCTDSWGTVCGHSTVSLQEHG
jgi:lysophosphatidic acid acyltransferase/lysophosphatidylinositol acyltransferase